MEIRDWKFCKRCDCYCDTKANLRKKIKKLLREEFIPIPYPPFINKLKWHELHQLEKIFNILIDRIKEHKWDY